MAERAGDRFRIYLLQFYEGQAYVMIGDPHRARELLENSIALAKQLGTTTLLAWGLGLLATALLALNEDQPVAALCEEAIRLAEDTRDRLANALAHRTLAEALARLTPPDIDRRSAPCSTPSASSTSSGADQNSPGAMRPTPGC